MKTRLHSISLLAAATLLAASSLHAGTATKSATGADLADTTAGAWTGGSGANGSPNDTDLVKIDATVTSGTLSVSAPVIWKQLNFTSTGQAITLSGDTITLENGTNDGQSSGSWSLYSNTGNAVTIDNNLDFGATGTRNSIAAAGAGILTLNGNVTATGDTTSQFLIRGGGKGILNGTITSDKQLAKVDGGTWSINSDNTGLLNGGVKIQGGTLLAGDNGAFGAGTITIDNGGSATTGTIGVVADTGARTLANNVVFSGAVNTLSLDSTNDSITLNGNISESGAGIGSKLTVTGVNTVTLAGTNTFTGGATVNGGTLVAGSSAALGASSGAITVNSGTLDLGAYAVTQGAVTVNGGTIQNGTLTGTSYTTGSGTIAAVLAGSGALTKSGSGTTILWGDNTYSGGTTISGGSLGLGNASALGTGSLTLTATGNALVSTVPLSGSVTIDNAIVLNNSGTTGFLMLGGAGNNVNLAGNITGTTAQLRFDTNLVSDGAAVFTLSGDNTFTTTSEIYVNRGSLRLGSATALGASTNTLHYDSNAGTLSFAGSYAVANNINFTYNPQNLDTGGNTVTLSGVIGGNQNLTKIGSGTLIFANANTYTGATSIDGGTLLLNGVRTAGASAVTVKNGAVLGGSGTHLGTVTVNDGGTLQGGSGESASEALTIDSGAITLVSGSIIRLALGDSGAASKIIANGGIAFAADQKFTFLDLGAKTGSYAGLITGVNADPGTSNWTITNDGWLGSFAYDAGTQSIMLNLTAVPEPGTYGLIGAGALAAVALVRRRRKFAGRVA